MGRIIPAAGPGKSILNVAEIRRHVHAWHFLEIRRKMFTAMGGTASNRWPLCW